MILAFSLLITIFITLLIGDEHYHIINPTSNITCPISINGTCFIECTGNSTTSQCIGITMNCGKASNCTIKCDTNSCFQSTIINKNVNVMNLFMSGNSFNNSLIFANMLNEDSIVNLNCFHNLSQFQNFATCFNISLNFIAYNKRNIGSVYIDCNSPASCSNSNIFAETINYLWLNCSNPMCITSSNLLCVCSNINISTPIFGTTDILMTQQSIKNAPSGLNLFNIQGYNNLNLIGSIFPQTQTMIHCGLLYENYCSVTFGENDLWNCSNNNYLCLNGNNIYDADKVSLQLAVSNFMSESKNESIFTDITCEKYKNCFIYPQSLMPLVLNNSNIYRFHCAQDKNCSIVYCAETCKNMIINANNTNNTYINCNHFSNLITGDCRNSNISAHNANIISLMFNEFYEFTAINSFSNSSIYAMSVSLLQIDAFHYNVEHLTVYTSLKYYDGRNGVYLECERCSYSNIYYVNNKNENKMDYLYINCNDKQTTCSNMVVYYDLKKYYGCNMIWRTASNSYICNPFDDAPVKKRYDDSWWTYTIFIPVGVMVVIAFIYMYRSCCVKKDKKPKILGYGPFSDPGD